MNNTTSHLSVSAESLPAPAPRRQRIAGAGCAIGSAPPCRERPLAEHALSWRAVRVGLATTLLAGVVGALGGAAGAETLGYPNANASAYRPTTIKAEYWVDENGDGRKQVPAELISARTYPYRNGTDFVAWKLQSLGVPDTTTRSLGAAGDWATNAAQRTNVAVRNTPVRFGVAVAPGVTGHVAFINDVLTDGRITVVEYDALGTGEGRLWTGTPASRGYTKFLDFGLSIGRIPGSPIAIARNADGRLEAFGVTPNGTTEHRFQWNAGGLWTDWIPFAGDFTAIAADTNADGRLEVFGVAADGGISHKWQTSPGGDWSHWTKVPGGLDTIALAKSFDGRLEAFGTNSRQGIYRKAEVRANGAWSNWLPFGSGLTDITAERNADGRLEVFGVSASGAIWHTWQSTPGGNWWPLVKMEGHLDRIAMTRSFDGKLEVFGTNAARVVYHKTQLSPGGPWSAWTPFGGGLTSIAAETNADGRIELFGVASNGAIQNRWQLTPGGRWSQWTNVAGSLRP